LVSNKVCIILWCLGNLRISTLFIASVISYFVQQFFPWQLSNLGAANIFLLYTVSGVAGFALLFKFMPETKNKSIEEIEVYLEGLHTKKVQEGV